MFRSLYNNFLQHLAIVLKWCEEKTLYSFKKCHFIVKEGIILEILAQEMRVDSVKNLVIEKLPLFTSMKAFGVS